jgi:integrase/recombinase XerD
MQIVNEKGERLYFTEEQRKALLAAAAKAPREVRSFCSVLCFTGCRISEALALTAKSIDLSLASDKHRFDDAPDFDD